MKNVADWLLRTFSYFFSSPTFIPVPNISSFISFLFGSNVSFSLCYSMLDDFAHEMDTTESKMDNVMKKMAKVLHMSNGAYQNLGVRFPPEIYCAVYFVK